MSRLLYGVNPIKEFLLSRPRDVSMLYLQDGEGAGAAIRELRGLALERNVPLADKSRAELDALVGREARHQGAVAVAGDFDYAELKDVLDKLRGRSRPALLVLLDGVQDPHNLGAIIRSAHVLGADAVIVPKDRAAPVTPAVVKASAGATLHIPVVRVTNLARCLEELKDDGIWTVGAVSREAPAPAALDLSVPVALVLGAEGAGLRPLVEKSCDLHVQIPMAVTEVGSLNVSVAAGVLLYEAARQRAQKR